MKKRWTKEKGITLIALVVTIIVLIILAGVSIALILGDNGIVTKAKEGATKYDKAQAREKLELVLMEIHAEKANNDTYTDAELVAKLEENEIQIEGNIVTVDGWQFEIDREKLEIIDEGNKIVEENKYIKVSKELEDLLKEAKMTVKVKDVLNTPDIINKMDSVPENNITAEELGQLLTNANIEEITLSQIVTNSEFTKDLINKLSIETIANNAILREHVNALIPTITEADVTREIIDGEITYRDSFGGKIRVPSEMDDDAGYSYFAWHAFDNDIETATLSEAYAAEGYYIEYEFAQPVYVIEIKYIMTHGSNHEGTRTIVIQGYDEETNQWKEVSEDLSWTGPNVTYEEDKAELNYTKPYKRYRLYVKEVGGNEFGSATSGLFSMQLYGKLAK